mmetsp:Transcript_10704/g.17970  ORF Transcript_10704/g.17970 Transcript_10704/m.17970 type:complete len:293 (+) Transcript_10704:34-912(+)|eukprot:CAMPEP_0168613936 /NCGR_PEP_ID=MMETSP0449_2-20121227/3711_1 /TAXON_ID=1082188 /ORGANISM="Strombidium rassoulzadegani, Strain ras09" /LENGTH=292 /DNA_ID=CAMNT_0008654591 /DNA_START=13 /DNA_END=891 /DNA_ORIENTATION=-
MGQAVSQVTLKDARPWLIAFGSTFLFNNLVFLNALRKKDNGIVDMTWSISLLIPNLITMFFVTQSYTSPRAILSNVLVTLWALRLSYHITKRHTGVEDYRYAKWRSDWEKQGLSVAYKSWSFVFMLQGMFSCVNNLSALFISIYAARIGGPLNWLDAAGALLWTTGFYFEAVGDYQLTKFKEKPENQGKVMTEGVWRYTRHPNYFGEAAMWWGIYLIACNMGLGGASTVLSAITITWLVRNVSGVAMLERKQKKKADFQVYMRETSPFIPMPYKKLTFEQKQEIIKNFEANQ